jgi:ribosomal protein S18 acetylase RimI-like enzyme
VAKKELREATAKDVTKIVSLINEAYLPAEGFLYEGRRIDSDEVRAKLDKGTFLLQPNSVGALDGSVYVEVRDDVGYFGLLAVSTDRQHHGLGRKLIASAEAYFKARDCGEVEIDVVNHRQELFGFYSGLGYHVVGQRPFEDPRLLQPSHFVIMRKTLQA